MVFARISVETLLCLAVTKVFDESARLAAGVHNKVAARKLSRKAGFQVRVPHSPTRSVLSWVSNQNLTI